MIKQGQKIVLVDDEETFRQRLEKAMRRRGLTVFGADGFDNALAVIQRERPELAVIDLRMPGRSGLELVAAARKIAPELAMVVLTGYGSIATATEAIRLGALAYLPKPADADEILHAFQRQPGQGLGTANPVSSEGEAEEKARDGRAGATKNGITNEDASGDCATTPATDFPAPSLARAEWEHINRVLTDCGGNISQAAQRLGLHRRTLQRKLQKFPPRQ